MPLFIRKRNARRSSSSSQPQSAEPSHDDTASSIREVATSSSTSTAPSSWNHVAQGQGHSQLQHMHPPRNISLPDSSPGGRLSAPGSSTNGIVLHSSHSISDARHRAVQAEHSRSQSPFPISITTEQSSSWNAVAARISAKHTASQYNPYHASSRISSSTCSQNQTAAVRSQYVTNHVRHRSPVTQPSSSQHAQRMFASTSPSSSWSASSAASPADSASEIRDVAERASAAIVVRAAPARLVSIRTPPVARRGIIAATTPSNSPMPASPASSGVSPCSSTGSLSRPLPPFQVSPRSSTTSLKRGAR